MSFPSKTCLIRDGKYSTTVASRVAGPMILLHHPEPERRTLKQSKNYSSALREIKSIRSYGGDIFFVGLAKVFAAQPIVPLTYDETASVRKAADSRQKMNRSANRAQERED